MVISKKNWTEKKIKDDEILVGLGFAAHGKYKIPGSKTCYITKVDQ